MKISEAQSVYRAYRKELSDQTRALVKQRDKAQARFQMTGSAEFSEQAATLQLSIDAVQEQFEKNQKVLDSLAEQYSTVWNAEVARQQADAAGKMGVEMAKIMAVAQRIANGDKVPYTDEKKLMEYSSELYQAAKNAQMLHEMEEHKEYDSLWDDSEEEGQTYDPEGKAENAEAQGELPDIPLESVGAGAAVETGAVE